MPAGYKRTFNIPTTQTTITEGDSVLLYAPNSKIETMFLTYYHNGGWSQDTSGRLGINSISISSGVCTISITTDVTLGTSGFKATYIPGPLAGGVVDSYPLTWALPSGKGVERDGYYWC